MLCRSGASFTGPSGSGSFTGPAGSGSFTGPTGSGSFTAAHPASNMPFGSGPSGWGAAISSGAALSAATGGPPAQQSFFGPPPPPLGSGPPAQQMQHQQQAAATAKPSPPRPTDSSITAEDASRVRCLAMTLHPSQNNRGMACLRFPQCDVVKWMQSLSCCWCKLRRQLCLAIPPPSLASSEP
jgi:hypothetical protein